MKTKKRSDNYWAKRSMERLTSAEKNSLPYLKKVKSLYSTTARATVGSIKALYSTYYKNDNTFDKAALNSIAPTGDLRKFRQEMKRLGLSSYLPDNYKGRLTRLELLNAQSWVRIKELAQKETELTTQAYRKTYEDTYYKSIYDTSKGTRANIAFSTLDENTVNKVLETKFYGENYSQRVWANTDELANGVQGVIGNAISLGQSPEKTIADVMALFGTRSKTPKQAFYKAARLVRTETNYFENKAELDSYEEMEIEKFKFLAVLDMRTSEICREHDGDIFLVKKAVQGENVPPLHPNCRSTIVPYLGEDYEPKMRIARDPETGKNMYVQNMSYKEWYKEYVEDQSGIIYEKGARLNKSELKVAKWARGYFNSDIKVLKEINKKGVKTPDLSINGTKFEIKNTSGSLNTLDGHLRTASKQAPKGNIIVDITGSKYSAKDAIKVAQRRVERNNINKVYMIKNGKLIAEIIKK